MWLCVAYTHEPLTHTYTHFWFYTHQKKANTGYHRSKYPYGRKGMYRGHTHLVQIYTHTRYQQPHKWCFVLMCGCVRVWVCACVSVQNYICRVKPVPKWGGLPGIGWSRVVDMMLAPKNSRQHISNVLLEKWILLAIWPQRVFWLWQKIWTSYLQRKPQNNNPG